MKRPRVKIRSASSVFAGWSGDCVGTGACQVTLDQTRSATASLARNAPPHASFTVACTGLKCDFDATGSTDSDSTIATYASDFGDGTSAGDTTTRHTDGHARTCRGGRSRRRNSAVTQASRR